MAKLKAVKIKTSKETNRIARDIKRQTNAYARKLAGRV